MIHSTIDLPFIDHDFISHLVSVKRKLKNKCIMACLNVNSYKYTHLQLNSIFKDMLVDVFAIAETKLNKNHHCNGQFEKHNYKKYRGDQPLRGNYGGCIVVYVNTNILCQRSQNMNVKIMTQLQWNFILVKGNGYVYRFIVQQHTH